MKRVVGVICFAVLCCAASRVSANAADDFVLAYLRERGIPLGVNSRVGEIVAIGHASCPSDSFGNDFASLRDKCHKIASLDARSEILQTLAATSSGVRDSGLRHDGMQGERTASLACKAFSERVLSGWRVMVSRECIAENRFSVAVAIAWSPSSERRFDDLKAGHLMPAQNWKKELLAYIDGQDLTSWADVRLFVDSAGFPHLMGIGMAEWDGHRLFRDAALRRAEMLAQKNLLLALYGDSAIMAAAGKWRRDASSSSGHEAAQVAFYESLAEVCVTMPLPKGCRPIYVTETGRGQNGRKRIISVFSFEPPAVADAAGTGGGEKDRSTTSEVRPPGIMIFNPSTGKFEKQ